MDCLRFGFNNYAVGSFLSPTACSCCTVWRVGTRISMLRCSFKQETMCRKRINGGGGNLLKVREVLHPPHKDLGYRNIRLIRICGTARSETICAPVINSL